MTNHRITAVIFFHVQPENYVSADMKVLIKPMKNQTQIMQLFKI